jgi:hypothetical protein
MNVRYRRNNIVERIYFISYVKPTPKLHRFLIPQRRPYTLNSTVSCSIVDLQLAVSPLLLNEIKTSNVT